MYIYKINLNCFPYMYFFINKFFPIDLLMICFFRPDIIALKPEEIEDENNYNATRREVRHIYEVIYYIKNNNILIYNYINNYNATRREIIEIH